MAFDKEGKLQQGKEDMQLRRKSGKKKAIDPRVARAKLVLQAIERSDMESIAVSRPPPSVHGDGRVSVHLHGSLGQAPLFLRNLQLKSLGRRVFCT